MTISLYIKSFVALTLTKNLYDIWRK